MRIQPAPLLLFLATFGAAALLVSSCGGGGEKEAYAAYENRINPLLAEEERVMRQFGDASADLLHYGASDKLTRFIMTRLKPFTAKLKAGVDAVKPEGEKLGGIHAYLVDYAQLRADFISVFSQLDALEQRANRDAAPIRKRLEDRMKTVVQKGEAIQPAYQAAPEFARSIGETLNQIMASAQQYQKVLQALDGGLMPSAQYVQQIDGGVLPWLKQTKLSVASLTPDATGEKLQIAVLAYLNEMEGLVKASRPLAEIRAAVEKDGMPIQQRLSALQREATQTLATYKEEVEAYRNSLR
jgi:hypothetical protein